MQRTLLQGLVTGACIPLSLLAGSIKLWQFADVAQAPVLIVGRVGAIHNAYRGPANAVPLESETQPQAAKVEVIRSYSSSGRAVKAGTTIEVKFLAHRATSRSLWVNGPALVSFTAGDVLVMPVRRGETPDGDSWMPLRSKASA